MAKQSNTDEENKKLKEQIELLKKRLELQQESFDLSSSIVDSLKEVLGIESRRSTMEKATLKTNKDINTSILNQKTGLSDLNTIQKQLVKNNDLIKKGRLVEKSLLSSIGGQLSRNGKIIENRIKKQAEQNKQLAEYNKRIEEGQSIDIQSYNNLKDKIALNEELLSQGFGNLSSLEQQYILTKQNTKALEEQQKVREAEKGIQKQLETQLGLSGKLAKTLGIIPGVGDASKKALEEVTKELQLQVETTGKLPSRWKTFGMLVGKTAKSLGKGLTDPLVILGYLSEADKGAGDLAKSMSMTYQEALGTRKELGNIAASSMDVALNTKNLQETLMFVGKQLGSNAKLNEADLKTFTKLREQAGLTNEEIMGMQSISLANGRSLEQNTKEFFAQAKVIGLNKGVLLNEKDLYKDISKISAATTLSLGKNPKELAKAAATAKSLGIEMSKLEEIAGGLLDFESSIENELSAELLTGKDLNLERARLLALNNDIAGMAEEINKQIGSSAEYTKMNNIQQEALAKSVGMSRDELAKTLITQEQLRGLSKEDAKDAKYALDQRIEQVGVAQAQKELEDGSLETLMHQQSIQERFNQTVEKLKDIFVSLATPILSIISPIADLVGYMASIVGYVINWGKYLLPIIAAYKTFQIITATILALKQSSNIADAISLRIGKSKIGQEIILQALILKESIAEVIGGAWKSLGPIPFVGAALAAAAAATGVGYLMSKANDMMSIGSNSPGYGKRTLMGPEGAIQLNDKDTVIAGTNLFGDDVTSSPGKPTETAPKGTMKVAGGTPDMEQTNILLRQLISVVQSGGVVTLDGQKVGEALKLSSYKSQ
jgi:hypothetical protein